MENKSKYKGIIFDLDGVLCFTDEYHYRAWKAIADKYGVRFDREANNRLRGVSRIDSLNIILECADRQFSHVEKESMAEEKNEIYKKLLSGMSPCDVKEETRDTLAALKAMGLLLAIGSSSRNAPYILNKTQLEGFFDAVSDGNNISRSKPDPEVFLKAAQMLGLLPAECLVIEDAHAGIEAGAAGGFDTAGIGDARNCEKRSFAIDEVADILKIVENARLPK